MLLTLLLPSYLRGVCIHQSKYSVFSTDSPFAQSSSNACKHRLRSIADPEGTTAANPQRTAIHNRLTIIHVDHRFRSLGGHLLHACLYARVPVPRRTDVVQRTEVQGSSGIRFNRRSTGGEQDSGTGDRLAHYVLVRHRPDCM